MAVDVLLEVSAISYISAIEIKQSMELFNDKVKLEQLTVEDADSLYKIYTHPDLIINFDERPFSPTETIEESTAKLIRACEFFFTIRPVAEPGLIIGDCALHHWDKEKKELEIGGSLLPEYWGKGFMQAAFELLITIAKQELGAHVLLGSTSTKNSKAIRLVEKMGFVKQYADEQNTIMRKEI